MESIKLKNSIIHYYGSPSGYLKDGKATVDTMFECEELKDWCQNRRYAVTFTEGIFDRLARKENLLESQENEISLKNVRIWQLNADSDFSMRFISFENLRKSLVSRPRIIMVSSMMAISLPTISMKSMRFATSTIP